MVYNKEYYKRIMVFVKNIIFIRPTTLVLLVLLAQVFVTTVQAKTERLTKPSPSNVVPNIQWAGFAFLGDWNQRSTRYPYTAKIVNQKVAGGLSIIDNFLKDKLNNFSTSGYNLRPELGDLESGKGLSMALGISYEDVYVIPFGGDYKVSYEIGLNLVVFDFVDKKVVTVYPLRFLRNELFKHRPTKQENEKNIKSLYSGNGFNIIQKTIDRMKSVVIRPSYGNYIGIRNIDISNKALEKIPRDLQKNNIIKSQIAQQFEGLISKNTYTPIVPYTKGEIIGRNMAARFSNGEAYNLKLPELDYFIDLELRKFKKKESKHHQGFTALATVKVETPLGNSVNVKLSNNSWVLNKMAGDGTKRAQWSIYEESLTKLLEDFSKNLAVSEPKWLKKHSATKDANEQLNRFREILKKSQ